MADQIRHINVTELQANPLQPRSDFRKEDLQDLVTSIEEHGIIEPLVVAETPAGLQIIAGERRWRAAKIAGLKTVPAVIKKTTPRGMLEMALIENVQRVDLNALERAKAFQRLMTEFRLSNAEISKKIGKSGSFVSNTIRLLQLPDAIKDGLLGGMIAEGHARALAAIENPRMMVEAYKTILKENGSVRRAEALARLCNEQLHKKEKPILPAMKKMPEEDLDKWEIALQKALGPLSVVKLSRSVRQTKVYITLKGDPYRTQAKLEKILQIAK